MQRQRPWSPPNKSKKSQTLRDSLDKIDPYPAHSRGGERASSASGTSPVRFAQRARPSPVGTRDSSVSSAPRYSPIGSRGESIAAHATPAHSNRTCTWYLTVVLHQ